MMKNHTVVKKRFFTFQILYYWGKFLGINPLNLSTSNDLNISYYSFFYACFLFSAYSYIFYRVLIDRLELQVPGESPISIIVSFMSVIIGFIELGATWFIYGFFQNRIKFIVKSFMKLERTSRKLNIPENYKKRFNKLGIYLTIVNLTYVMSVVINNRILAKIPNFHSSIWTSFTIPRLAVLNSGTLFIWCLLTVKRKFHQLNDKVRFIMRNDYVRTGEPRNEMAPGLISNSSSNPIFLSDRINIISQLHRELRDVIRCIEGHFALMVLFRIIVLLTNMTLNSYVFSSFVNEHISNSENKYISLGVFAYWTIFPMIQLTIISTVCASTSEEANETGNILHAMLNNCINYGDAREAAKFNAFSLELLQNQVSLSVFGLINLDYFLIRRIIRTGTIYLTIMLQFSS